jgi:membrane-associated phospholipid phosphatase
MGSGFIARVDTRITETLGVRERGANRVSVWAEPRFIALEAIGLALFPRLRTRDRALLIGAPLLAGVVGHGLKKLFPRDRPAKHRFTPQGNESFPSTHAAHSAALLLATARVARRHGAGHWVYVPASAIATVIGIERIRGAAHWPTDVLAGWLLGAAAATCAMAATEGR